MDVAQRVVFLVVVVLVYFMVLLFTHMVFFFFFFPFVFCTKSKKSNTVSVFVRFVYMVYCFLLPREECLNLSSPP